MHSFHVPRTISPTGHRNLQPAALQVAVAPSSPLMPFTARRAPVSTVVGGSGPAPAHAPASGGAAFAAPDLEGKLMELHEAQVREMKDRMAADKDLREHFQQNQEAISGIAARIDELLFDLRSEVPRLRQENTDLASELRHTKGCVDNTGQQLTELQQQVYRDRENRQQTERTAHQQMLELMKGQEQRVDQGMASMHALLDNSNERARALQDGFEMIGARVQKLESKFEHESSLGNQRDQSLANDVLELRQRFDQDYQRLCVQTSHCAGLIEKLDQKVAQITPAVQKWAEDACIPRITAVEESVRLEIAERSVGLQRLAQAINTGHAQVQDIKSKIDDNSLQAATSPGTFTDGGYRSGGSVVVKQGTAGPTRRTSGGNSVAGSTLDVGRSPATSRAGSMDVPRGSMYVNTRHTLPAAYRVHGASSSPRGGSFVQPPHYPQTGTGVVGVAGVPYYPQTGTGHISPRPVG